jgi:hypothetical protein
MAAHDLVDGKVRRRMHAARLIYRRFTIPGGTGAHASPLTRSEKKRYSRLAAEAERDIEEQGFTCVPDLFSSSELETAGDLLRDLFGRFAELSSPEGGYSDWVFDAAKVGQTLGKVQQPEILNATSIQPQLRTTAVFEKICEFAAEFGFNRLCFDHAMLKMPNGSARTPLHQDARYVAEEFQGRSIQHPGFRFWIPFQDTTTANGCMEYVPGSHRQGVVAHQGYRRSGQGSGWEADLPANGRAVPCPVPAGGVAIHTPLTLHGAGANTTPSPRLAWILNFDRISLMQAAGHGLATRLRSPINPAPAG